MYLGDNLLRDGITDLVGAFREHEPEALILLTKVLDPWHYGVAELDGGAVVRLVEKPAGPAQRHGAGRRLHVHPGDLRRRPRDRALRRAASSRSPTRSSSLIDGGSRVESHHVGGWWKDTGQLADMLEANRLVLEDLVRRVDGELDEASRVEGRVVIEAGATLERSLVRGPAVIGAGARIVDSYVGPYTSIDCDVEVIGTEVEHSILLAGASVKNLPARIEASLLGKDVKLARGEGMPKTLRMIVGDKSEITIP